MGNLFSALHISGSALSINQSAMSIISNNISNMNTEGYHKQRVNIGTMVVGSYIGGSVEAQVNTSVGTDLIRVERYTSPLEGDYYNSAISRQAYLNEQQKSAENIAQIFDEIQGSGLESAISNLYAKLDNLNQYPEDSASRDAFIDAAQTLADTLNSVSKTISKQKTASVGDGITQQSLEKSELYQAVSSFNQGLKELAGINKMIMSSQSGSLENNNLLDRRDAILKDLAQYAEFETETSPSGAINLKLKGTNIVSGSVVNGIFDVKYSEEGVPVVSFSKENGDILPNVNKKFNSGKIGGLLDTSDYDNSLTELDELAETFANIFNKIQTQSGAYYFDGNKLSNENLEQYKIFVSQKGDKITASNITVNPKLDENKIAAAYFQNSADVDLNAVGNSNNIGEMLKTKNELTGKYSGILGKISSKAASTTSAAEFQESVVQSIENKINEQTGVDMNEELANLVKFQTAFEASARVFNVCNQVLDTLMHLGE